MGLFKEAKLADWVAVVLLVGSVLVFSVRATVLAKTNSGDIQENKSSIEMTNKSVSSLSDSVLALTLNNRSEHKALKKTSDDTYKVIKLMAEQQGIIVP